jgi:hypothetical protein
MTAKSVQVFLPLNQEYSLPLSRGAATGALPEHDGRDGSRRFSRAFAALCKRMWMPLLAVALLACQDAWAQNGVFATATPVAVASGAQSVTVTAQTAGTVAQVEVLTMGAPNLDFTGVSGSTPCSGALLVNQTCTESVTFTPASPGLRQGAVVLLDSSRNVLGMTYLSGTGLGGLPVLVSGNVSVVAGVYRTFTSTKDGIPATGANLKQPSSVAFDGAGNMYIADSAHNRIRMVCAGTSATIAGVPCKGAGIIWTVAGTGAPDYTGDGGPATDAALNVPTGIALDGAGNLYIADTNNSVIRKVTAATGIITTVAGPGVAGTLGDGQAATSAYLNQPEGITVDVSGNLYIADTYNQLIRKVDASTGDISTVAGNGEPSGKGDGKGTYTGDGGQAIQAGLSLPYAVAFDVSGNMYIPDSSNNVVRMVTPSGIIGTFVGHYPGNPGKVGVGGLAAAASLSDPTAVTFDPAGNLYVADTQNARILKISASSSATPGIVSVIAVSGGGNIYTTGGAVGTDTIFAPTGIFLDGNANLYFADYYFMWIQKVQSQQAVLNFTATPIQQGTQSLPLTQAVENDGNAPLDLTNTTIPDVPPNAAIDPGTTTCLSAISVLAVDADCQIGAVFVPALPPTLVFPAGVTSEQLTGDVDLYGNTENYPSNTENFPLDILVVGVATPVNATTTVVTSKPNPSNYGQAVTFTATVKSGATNGTPVGTVIFMNGATQLGPGIGLNAMGQAIYTTTTPLPVGPQTITASFTGAATSNYLPSSGTIVQNVDEVTVTTLTSSANPSALGAPVTFTAKVTISGGGGVVPDGTVIFTDTTTGTILGTQTLGANGIVALPLMTTLTQGVHAITATYSGDATNDILGSTSAILSQDVQAPATITLGSSPNPSTYGTPVTFTVTVPTIGTAAATGTVNILEAGQTTPIGTITVAGNPATGTFTTSSLPAGQDVITANFLDDKNYGPGSASVTQEVDQAQTATVINSVPNPGIAGLPVALTATVTVTKGAATTTGTVSFADTFAGATVNLGTATLGAGGTATIKPLLAPGAHSIVATYAGDKNDNGSASAPLALTVVQATTQTTVTATPNPALVEQTVTFTATVTGNGGPPTGKVTFSANGNAIAIGTASVGANGIATITNAALAAGTYSITAVYSGDTDDATSTGATSLVVGTIPTVADLGETTTTGANPQVILVATVLNNVSSATALPTPTGTVTFIYGATVVGASALDASGVATLVPNLPTGTYKIVAAYSGDPLHSPSSSNVVTISTSAEGFNLAVTPPSVTIAATKNATVNVDLNSNNGFTDTIGLGCASLPAGVTCHFSSDSVKLAANGAQKIELTIDTNNPLGGGGSSAMNARPGGLGLSLAGLFLPLSVLFGCIFWRFRKRCAALMTTALVLLLGSAALLVSGCSGFSQSSAAPGTYVIQVTGVGTNSDITHYQNVSLTITK